MSASELPERVSLEYLKKLAKDRLQTMRRSDPTAKRADALLAVARDHGFTSWRALKHEVDRRQSAVRTRFFEACQQGDAGAVGQMLTLHPDLAQACDTHGAAALHIAAQKGWLEVAHVLLAHGADRNARDRGDNATPLHFAAGTGHVEVARALLDAGADVHGFGDLHEADVIGWATMGAPERVHWDVLALLRERGARHHVFSAIAAGDPAVLRELADGDPDALDRTMSRYEQGRTPLQYAIRLKRYDLLDLLIELGADVEARDGVGRTAMSTAMLTGDKEAMARLRAAGAREPEAVIAGDFTASMASLASSISKGVPMIAVADVAASLGWYASIGFRELARYGDDGRVNFGMVAFGGAELMLSTGASAAEQKASLWFYTDRIEELYALFRARQIDAAKRALAGETGPDVAFWEDLYEPFYGGKQFSIRDPDGYALIFLQPQA